MRKIASLFPALILMSGCASGVVDHDNGRWLVTHKQGETDYEMAGAVLFPYDSAEISNRAYDIIASVAKDARAHARAQLRVEGFTDTSGSHDYNMSLSQARAERVADVLVHQGIAPARILATGYGETRPAVRTANGVREPRNRRVVIRMLGA